MGWMIWGMERRRRKAKERGFEIEESRGRRWEWIGGEIKSQNRIDEINREIKNRVKIARVFCGRKIKCNRFNFLINL